MQSQKSSNSNRTVNREITEKPTTSQLRVPIPAYRNNILQIYSLAGRTLSKIYIIEQPDRNRWVKSLFLDFQSVQHKNFIHKAPIL